MSADHTEAVSIPDAHSMRWPRGSEWRKWDLHFHTPASYEYRDKSVTNQEIVDVLKASGIAAVAVTDHHTMDTLRIKELQRLGSDDLTVFPGIELRTELGGSESVHIIGIFPEGATLEHIWTTLQGKLDLTGAALKAKGDHKIPQDIRKFPGSGERHPFFKRNCFGPRGEEIEFHRKHQQCKRLQARPKRRPR